jgi:hypothetical protein
MHHVCIRAVASNPVGADVPTSVRLVVGIILNAEHAARLLDGGKRFVFL